MSKSSVTQGPTMPSELAKRIAKELLDGGHLSIHPLQNRSGQWRVDLVLPLLDQHLAPLREAILPLAQIAGMYEACEDQFALMTDSTIFHEKPNQWSITVGHIRALRAALAQLTEEPTNAK